jgi:sodium/bile acid cotransporter 7
MRQIFLPLGLLLAALSAFILPTAGVLISEHGGISICIVVIFLVSGYQAGIKGIPLNKGLPHIFLTAAAVSLFLSPLLGLAVTKVISLPRSLITGLVIICAVPPTLSSGIVITGVSRGNTVLALMLTISLNLLGILTLPVMLDLCLKAAGPVAIDRIALLVKMLLLVLLPFVLGRLIRTWAKKKQVSANWSYVNSSCVILAVHASLAVSRDEFFSTGMSEYAAILVSVSLIHLLLLGGNAFAAKMLALNPADSRALIFVASQKTLPVSLAVLAGMGDDTGNAVIACLMFHFFQLFADSLLASYLRWKA